MEKTSPNHSLDNLGRESQDARPYVRPELRKQEKLTQVAEESEPPPVSA